MVLGRFFSGFLISPATAATFVTPAYEIYKKATALIKPEDSFAKTGSVREASKEPKPKKTIQIKDRTLILTIISWVFSTFLTPKIFNNKIRRREKRAILLVRLESISIKTYNL